MIYPNAYPNVYPDNPGIVQQKPNIQQYKDKNIPTVLQYIADTAGCGLYRMGWPQQLLNFTDRARVFNSSLMVGEPSFYTPISVVRIQRQAKTEQKDFVRYLCDLREEYGFKLHYEIDDCLLHKDLELKC